MHVIVYPNDARHQIFSAGSVEFPIKHVKGYPRLSNKHQNISIR